MKKGIVMFEGPRVTREQSMNALRPPAKSRVDQHAERGAFTTALRQSTEAIHNEVETANRVNGIIAGTVEPVSKSLLGKKEISQNEYDRRRDQYQRAYVASLHASFGFERAFEVILDESDQGRALYATLGFRPTYPLASALIERDLQAFGEVPMKLIPDFPPMLSDAERIGALYVRIGSRMGGLVIAHHVNGALDLDETNGASFYRSLRDGSSADFRQFRLAVDAYSDDQDTIALACVSANAVFRTVGDWQKTVYEQLVPDLLDLGVQLQKGTHGGIVQRLVNFFVRED
jgi:heme oxygenase